ncbi:MAG: ROK family protein [Clostridium sp.]|uniref:ROK family protein n=1 Tax=Clostridium sp. TaxID=1506 RepID=UPI003EE42B23
MFYLGIDIGGTNIKYGITDINGNVLFHGKVKTTIIENNNFILNDIDKIIQIALEKYQINGIGISTAGVVDVENGKIIYAGASIPNYTGTELKKHILEKYNLTCIVENDVNSAALGELWKGAGRGKENIFCLTVGTGIGGACIINKKLIYGKHNSAGEVGYMHIFEEEIQNIASTTALVKMVKDEIDEEIVDGKYIFNKAIEGDEVCIKAINHILKNIAMLIVNINYVIAPDIFILGGGIMEQREYIKPILEMYILEKTRGTIFKSIEVVFSEAGNMAGVLGAIYKLKEIE